MRPYSHGHPFFLPPSEIARNCPIPDLLDKRLVFVTGKGGVGKTTVAVGLGLRAAAEGKRAIVCEVAAQENASRFFDHIEVGFHEVEMEENLWAISIDPDESMREYVLLQLKVRAMRDLLFRSRVFTYLAAATPGLKELVTIGKIWELTQLDRKVKSGRKYDLVIVDAPATGHGIGFLQTPRTFAAIARVGPIHSQAQQLNRLITDQDHTGTAIVALPEEMPVNESAALEQDLRDEVGVAVDRIYLNGLYPERFSKEEAERLAGACRGQRGHRARRRPRGALRARPRPLAAGPAGAAATAGEDAGQDTPVPVRARPRRRGRAPALAEAELMPAVDEILEGKDICICAGSGGVGKTTTSAAIALGMAARGLRVCVLTIDPAKRLADSLGMKELGNEAERVDPQLFERQGVEIKGELWAMMLDAKATFDELVARQAPDEESRDRVLENRIYQQISNALAGSQEYMAMEKLFELHTEGRFDLLVLDTPPTRNALDFLEAPKRLTQFIEGRSLRVFMRPTGLAARVAGRGASAALSVLKRIVGFDLIADLAEFFNAFSGMVDGFQARARRVNGLLADSRTCFLVVCGPQGEPVDEAVYFHRKLVEAKLPFGGVIVNKVHYPAERLRGEAVDLEAALTARLGDEDLARRVAENFADYQALAERDARNIERLTTELRTRAVIRVPYLDEDVHDLGGLAEIDRYLFATSEERVALAAGRA